MTSTPTSAKSTKTTPASTTIRSTSSVSSNSGPLRATYAYSSLGMLGHQARSPRGAVARTPSVDRITRNASPSRKTLEWQSESIVPRVPQPYRTSFSAVTSPHRVRAPSESPPAFSGPGGRRGTPVRATMPGRIRPAIPGVNTKTKSNDDMLSPDEAPTRSRRITKSAVPTAHKSNDELLTPDETDNKEAKLPGKKSDVRFLSTPTKLHNIDSIAQGMPPKSNGVDSSNDMLDTTFESVFTDDGKSEGSFDRKVSEFMTPTIAVTDENSKAPDSGFVVEEGRVERKTLIQKEYVHMQTVTPSILEKMRKKNKLPKPDEQTEQIVADLQRSRKGFFGRSKSMERNDSTATSPKGYQHKDRQGRSRTLPSEEILGNAQKQGSVRKSLSSSISKIFRRMSPKSVRKFPPNSSSSSNSSPQKKTSSSAKSTPEGSDSSLFGGAGVNEICDIDIDTVPNSVDSPDFAVNRRTGASRSVENLEPVLDRTLTNGAITNTKHTGDTDKNGVANISNDKHMQQTCSPIPANSARLLKSIENNAATLKNTDNYKTRLSFATSTSSASSIRHDTMARNASHSGLPNSRTIEAISMKPQALRAVEFNTTDHGSPNTNNDTKHGTVVILKGQSHSRRFGTPPRQLSADQADSVEPMASSLKQQCNVRILGSDEFVEDKDMTTGINKNKFNKPPSTLNIRQMSHLGRSALQSTMSSESIGGCSLDPYNTGSEPSLVSARRNGSSKSASKRTLHSEDTLDSSLSPSPAATSNGAATHPLEDITQILNHTGTYNSNGERKTFSGSNSTNTNMTFSNNNPPPPPSGSGSNGNIDVSSPPPNPAGAMSSPTTSTASPKTPSYLKLASSLAGYGNAAYGSPPTQQKKLIVIKRGTSENRHDKEGLGGVLDSEDELDKCDHNGVVLSSRGDKYIVQQNGCVDTNASVNMGEPVGVVVEARKARSRSRSSEPDSHKSRSVTSPDQPLMSPVPVSITIKTKSTTNDSEIVGTTTEVSPLRESSPVPVLNGDVHKDVNGVDEVDFSFTRFHITEKIDDAFSQEEEIEISSPVKDGNYFLAVCSADEEKLKKLIVAVEELQKTQEVINSEDAQGRIAALVGKTNLLINQRFKQFRELCAKNLSQKPGDDKPTLNDDLQGFWDMVLLPVHELEDSFKEIHVLAANGWKMPEVKPPMRVNSRPASARTAIAVPQTAEERAAAKAAKEAKKAKAAEAAKARAEMRKKLMEAKKEAKNKEPAVEIFIA